MYWGGNSAAIFQKEGMAVQQVRLGKTEIIVSKNGFGALPIQRISKKEAVYLLQKAF